MVAISVQGTVTVDFDAQVTSSDDLPELFTHSAATPTGTAGGNNFTFFNTDLQFALGRFVKSVGLYSDDPLTGIIKIGERNGTQDWDVKPERDVPFSHPGGGWVDFDLSGIWEVPGPPAAAPLFPGVYTASGLYERATSNRTYKLGNVSGNGQSGFTVDSGPAPAMRYSYYNEMPAETGGTAELNWSVMGQEHPGIDASIISAVAGAVTQAPNQDGMAIDFIDVCRTDWGGDATLIIAPNGEAVLIDAGSPTMGAVAIVPHLKRRGVTSLKALFITHQNVDHIGGAAEIMDRFPVEALYLPVIPSFANFEQIMWDAMVAKATAKSIPITTVSGADTPGGSPRLSFGGVDLYVMQAFEMTFRIEWAQSSVLHLADAGTAQLNSLVASAWDLSADVIKNPHHGIGDGGFYTMLASFPTDTHVGTFPQKLWTQQSVRDEGAAIEAAGRDYYVSAKRGTISVKFATDASKQVDTYFLDHLFSLYHGRHYDEIYGSINPQIYNPSWAS